MKKQTVVQKIFEQMNLLSDHDFQSWMLNNTGELLLMEREQIKEAYIYGFGERDEIDKNLFFNPLAVEYNEKKFYNYLSETYKSYEQ